MKRVLAFFFALSAAFSAAAAANDLVLTFSTPGPDRYADGSIVRDGECYALVFTPEGKTFSGFTADGRAADPATGTVVLCAPVARDGRCPTVVFQIPAGDAPSYTNGTLSIHLLDTRRYGEEGAVSLAPVSGGRPQLVNASSRVANVKAAAAEADPLGDDFTRTGAGAAFVSTETSKGTPAPRITGIQVIDGYVYVSVRDTVPYVNYVLKEGDSPSGIVVPPNPDKRTGDRDREIIFVSPAKESSGFYSIRRD